MRSHHILRINIDSERPCSVTSLWTSSETDLPLEDLLQENPAA